MCNKITGKYKTFNANSNSTISEIDSIELEAQALQWLAENGDVAAAKELGGSNTLGLACSKIKNERLTGGITNRRKKDHKSVLVYMVSMDQDIIESSKDSIFLDLFMTLEISNTEEDISSNTRRRSLSIEDEFVLDLLAGSNGCEVFAKAIGRTRRFVEKKIIAWKAAIDSGNYEDGLFYKEIIAAIARGTYNGPQIQPIGAM